MGIFKLVLPKMGESVSEATLTKWLKAVGEQIQEEDAVAEIATDKVDSDVPSPVSGVIKEILFAEGAVVQVGDTIAILEIEGTNELETEKIDSDIQHSNINESEAQDKVVLPTEFEIPGVDVIHNIEHTESAVSHEKYTTEGRFYSPLVKSIALEETTIGTLN